MISFINKNDQLNENKNSLNISYLRTVNIIFGHYPYPERIHNFIIEIKNNLDPKMENYTNVKGGMTHWKYFIDKNEFKIFTTYLINKHQITHPDIFKYFFEKNMFFDAWGTEIKKGDSLIYHSHPSTHGILYLTKGCDLILPELNLKITPEPGDYYVFPSEILHGFDKYDGDLNRYSLVFNIRSHNNAFTHQNKINEL